MYSEMILGSVAVTHHTGNFKLHALGEGRMLMWSSIVQAPKLSQGQKSSDSSLGSSFGCSLGSFNNSATEEMGFGMFPDILERDPTNGADTDLKNVADSGCFPSFPSSSNIDASVFNQPGEQSYARRLSSNIDIPDYGSLCSLQRRFLTAVEPNLSFKETGESSDVFSLPVSPSSSFQKGDSSYKSGSDLSSRISKRGRKNALLGLGIIVEFSTSEFINIFLAHSSIVEDIYSHLLMRVQQAYIRKKRFVVTVYNGYLECTRMINNMFSVPRLKMSAWQLTIQDNTSSNVANQLVQDICLLKNLLDTKETNFMFSTLLTGVLTHHLGWVSTVMPGSKPGVNMLHKPAVQGLDQFRSEQWYDPTKVQYKELHGMLGFPVKLAKSFILSSKPTLSKRILFVLSYFIRCSLVYKKKHETTESLTESTEYKSFLLRECTSSRQQGIPLGKSLSSPTVNKKFHSEVNMLEALDLSASSDTLSRSQEEGSKVGFLLGADDNSPVFKHTHHDNSSSRKESLFFGESELNQVYLTHVPFSSVQYTDSIPADLASLICLSDEFMPGSVLQASSPSNKAWKSYVQDDLLAVSGNSHVSGLADECVCVVADVDNHEVSIVSAQQVVVGRSGVPVPMSPLVATTLENFCVIVELGLSTEDCLNYLEDQLQQIYLYSCTLSEYIVSADYTTLQNISKHLQVDPCDVPLLLAVASTHTPAVGKKLSLGFT
ncbi:folliculin-interacting protein 1 [Eurytemora carolleeae]|uniref:folliculin-interacting protein 1 n=1 Tax=Eurytemora carolleeae TaxID=1294199 RepID=UPI000C768F4E|nr:folliculin-interacting protein 1 [Eurytemora carolleeae]|eukprot:XP_023328968.1 folliculin-interacting protein 1-like [Eurytemora affinis]